MASTRSRQVRVAGQSGPSAARAQALRRRQALKRRRDVFFVLLGGVVGSLALALLPPLHFLFYLQVLFDLAFGLYLVLLIRLRNLAAERELKLTFLTPADQRAQAAPIRPSRQPLPTGTGRPVGVGLARPERAPAYSLAGYDDLLVRRAAN